MLSWRILKDFVWRRALVIAVPYIVISAVLLNAELSGLPPRIRFAHCVLFMAWPIGPTLQAIDVSGHRFSRALATLPLTVRTLGNTLFFQSVVFFPALVAILSAVGWFILKRLEMQPFPLQLIQYFFLFSCAYSAWLYFGLIHLKESNASGGSTARQNFWGAFLGVTFGLSPIVLVAASLIPFWGVQFAPRTIILIGLFILLIAWKQSPRLVRTMGGHGWAMPKLIKDAWVSMEIPTPTPHLYDSLLFGAWYGLVIAMFVYFPVTFAYLDALAHQYSVTNLLVLQTFAMVAIGGIIVVLRWVGMIRTLRSLPLSSEQIARLFSSTAVFFTLGLLAACSPAIRVIGIELWLYFAMTFGIGTIASAVCFASPYLLWRRNVLFIVACASGFAAAVFAAIRSRVPLTSINPISLAAIVVLLELATLFVGLYWLRRVIERSSEAYRAG